MSIHTISFLVNGSQETRVVPANLTLLQLLRESLALTGTKNGCSAGECGACTVLLNGEPVNACMVLAVEADGAEVFTVEGLAGGRGEGETGRQGEGETGRQGEGETGGRGEGETGRGGDGETGRRGDGETLHPLQQAFIDEGAVQCGFCTPGMLMSAYGLLQRTPQPTEDDIRTALLGNLCRCTGYTRIVRAIQKVAKTP